MKVYLLRHTEAEEGSQTGENDRARKLTEAGRRAARKLGRGLARLEVKPGAVWTSPYPRALETAELAAREMGIAKRVKPRVELEAGMEPEVAATLLGEEAGDSVMIVGHNPDLERLAAWLIDANGGAAIELKKGSVACVESEAPPGPGTGELRWLLTPRQLEIIGD